MASYKQQQAAIKAKVRDKLPRLDVDWGDFDDMWTAVAHIAGIELEVGDVPVQAQRHLITSWAAMRTGMNVAIRMLKIEHQNDLRDLRRLYEDRLADKDELRKAVEESNDYKFDAAALSTLPHISNENERALVSEELASRK